MLTAKLILDRFDKDYRLLERREQPCRSFTKGLLQLLYVAHAQIAYDSAYSLADIRGVVVFLDSSIYAPNAEMRGTKPNLAIGAPPGVSQIACLGSAFSTHGLTLDMVQNILLGEHLGIQVGGGTTAVTPTDNALETRFGHGIRPADGANVSFESYKTGDTVYKIIYGDNWNSRSFRPKHQHKLYTVKLKLFREGAPGTVTVDIHAGWNKSDFPGMPLSPGNPLVTGTTDGDTLTADTAGEWREITFPSQIELIPGMFYAILVHITGGDTENNVNWRHDATGLYPRGISFYSDNAGVGWGAEVDHDLMFEELGRSSGELQYAGCELADLTFSDPDGEFTLRRFFTNNSGEGRTVNEVGIYAAGERMKEGLSEPGYINSFCIAHDIVAPGVAVAAGELLRATYVPQITV